MKKSYNLIFLLLFLQAGGQGPILTVGHPFPDIVIRNISNAQVKEIYINKSTGNKFYILNFWGTWCSPCIPEMDTLAKLQKKNASKIQVIAISDDTEERKIKYLAKKPTQVWLATDTAYTLYNMLQLAYVGQSAIIGPDKKIVALVRTDSIHQSMIDQLLRGEPVKMSADIKKAGIPAAGDPFGVDSLMEHSFTVRGYKEGQAGMSQLYFTGPYTGRRISWHNVSINVLYRDAYGLSSYRKQEFYDSTVSEQDVHSHDMKNTHLLYSVDLLVSPQKKDSLYFILRQYLNLYLPIKARLERRKIEVYVLKKIPGVPLTIRSSTADKSSDNFSGRGYNGIKVTLSDFASDYLSNELDLPVLDETGLKGFYDINTVVDFRNAENIHKSIQALGLMLEKTERETDVIVYYKLP